MTAQPQFITSGDEHLLQGQTLANSRSADVLSFDDLVRRCSDDKAAWFVDNLVRRSGVLLMAAQPKVGKSDTARNLAKAVATGGTFLGRRCEKGKVLWIGLEEPVAHLIERADIMGMQDLDNIVYVVDQPPGDESAWLRARVEEHRPDLVVVDTIGRFSNIENINDYSQVKRATQPMLDLRNAFGITFVLLHHNNRMNGTLGSIMWDGVVDCIMSITRNPDGKRFVQTRQRSGADMELTALTLNHDTGEITCVESAFIADKRVAETKILAYLQTVANATRETLARNCGRKSAVGRSAVDSLVADGFVKITGDGTRKNPRLYSLTESSSFLDSSTGRYNDEDPGDPDGRDEPSADAGRRKVRKPGDSGDPGDPDGANLLSYASEVGL